MASSDFLIIDGVLHQYTGPGGDVVLPSGVNHIGDMILRNCISLTVPDTLTSIERSKLDQIPEFIMSESSPVLESLATLSNFLVFDPWNTSGASYRLTIKKSDGTFRKTAVSAASFSTCMCSLYEDSIQSFDMLLQSGRYDIYTINEECRIIGILDRLRDTDHLIDSSIKSEFISFLKERISKVIKLGVSNKNDLIFLIETGIVNSNNIKKAKNAVLRNVPELLDVCVVNETDTAEVNVDPLLEECEKWIVKRKWNAKLQKYRLLSFADVKLKDGSPAPELYSRFITSALMFSWFDKEFELAKQVADNMDKATYLDVMKKYYDDAYFKEKVILARPISFFADGNTVKKIYLEFEKTKFKEEALEAVMLSETREALIILEKKEKLEEYAELYNTEIYTLQERIVDLPLDSEGKKEYDLGNQKVIAQMRSDFSFAVIDPITGKTMKTLPKKGSDPVKYTESSKEFAELQKSVRKVATSRSAALLSAFLNEVSEEAVNWKKRYFENPVMHAVGKLVVWKQENTTFVITENGLEDSNGEHYMLTGNSVYVAHPMDMNDAELHYWQQYFVSHQIKQPFTQIWEPVIDSKALKEKKLLDGITLPFYRFTDKDIHGIHIKEYGRYSDPGIKFDECQVEVYRQNKEYEPMKIDSPFVIDSFGFKKFTKKVNHIAAYLLRCAAEKAVLLDDDSIILLISGFTYESISRLLNIAMENNCTNTTAILMDYKEKNFGNFDPMDEFTLDL